MIATEQVTKMLLAADNDMVLAISADRTDEPFSLPSRDRPIPYAHVSKTPDEAVRAIAIANDILWRVPPTACLG